VKTWQVFAIVAAVAGVGWLLFRRSSGLSVVPGSYTDGSTGAGPPSSVVSPSQAPTSAELARAQQEAPGDPVTQAALAKFYQALSIAKVAPSTGPATESRSGRAHF